MRLVHSLCALALLGCGGDPFLVGTPDNEAGGDPSDAHFGITLDAAAPFEGAAADAPTTTTDAAPIPPSGWALVEAAFAPTTPPACGGAWSVDETVIFDGLSTPAPTCGCECGAPAHVACALPVTGCSWDSNTGCSCSGAQTLTSGVCQAMLFAGASGVPTATGGACAPAPTTTIPPLHWTGQARVCSQSVAALPLPDPGFHVCVRQDGDLTCPSGFTDRHIEHSGATDTRACTPCTCGAPAGITCGGGVAVYRDTGCSSYTSGVGLNPGPCSGAVGGAVMYQATITGGTCAAANVTATGGAAPTDTITLCCR